MRFDLRSRVELVTGIEPVSPAWKARFPSVSFGWSQPFLPLTVPSACLCRRRGPRRPGVHFAYIGALMPKAAAVVPGWKGGIKHAVRDPGHPAHVTCLRHRRCQRPACRFGGETVVRHVPRTAVDRSVERAPSGSGSWGGAADCCRQAGGGPGGEAGDDGAGPGQAQGAQRVSARRVRRSPAAAGSRCSPARSAGVARDRLQAAGTCGRGFARPCGGPSARRAPPWER